MRSAFPKLFQKPYVEHLSSNFKGLFFIQQLFTPFLYVSREFLYVLMQRDFKQDARQSKIKPTCSAAAVVEYWHLFMQIHGPGSAKMLLVFVTFSMKDVFAVMHHPRAQSLLRIYNRLICVLISLTFNEVCPVYIELMYYIECFT